jgi:ubiquinone/menaquinone biosynthesis C-methylase UbiE
LPVTPGGLLDAIFTEKVSGRRIFHQCRCPLLILTVMSHLRASIKDLFYKTKQANVLDYLLFQFARLANNKKNADFKRTHPGLTIPPDYFLYETYKLNYEHFFRDGEAVAKEIIDWTSLYTIAPKRILDWGCGVSRVTMHLAKYTGSNTLIYGCDINEEMISFNKKNFQNIAYSLVTYDPPTKFGQHYFDMIYGLSVFTHIEAGMQENWIREIYRILNDGGIFLVTTQGSFFDSNLLMREKKTLDLQGVFTKVYYSKGHRMMSTYNSPGIFRQLLEKYFCILEFHAGRDDPSKTGGQDLWIVKKRDN